MIEDLKPYPEYKNSVLPWLGEVPAHWIERRAKYFFREVDERSETGDEELMSVSHKTGVTPRKQSVTMFLSESTVGYKVCRPGDIAINTMWAFMGALGIARQEGLVSPAYGVYRPVRPGIIGSEYLDRLLRTDIYKTEYIRRSTGINSSRLRLYPDQFLQVPLLCPPPEEQAAIARFLAWATNRLDRAIGAKRRIIALLQEQKQAIIHRAVTRGLDPSVPLKESGIPWLGEIPEHWELRRFKMLCSMKSGECITSESIEPAGQYPVYGGNGIRGYTSSFTHDGHFALVGRQGALCGNVHLAGGRFWASEHAVVTTLRAENDLGWFSELIRTMNLNQYSIAAAQPGLAVERIMNLIVPVPPPSEQARIFAFAGQSTIGLQNSIEHADAEITLLREYRTRLIADVVTGKLDVREVAAGLPEEVEPSIQSDTAGYDGDDAEDDSGSDSIDTEED